MARSRVAILHGGYRKPFGPAMTNSPKMPAVTDRAGSWRDHRVAKLGKMSKWPASGHRSISSLGFRGTAAAHQEHRDEDDRHAAEQLRRERLVAPPGAEQDGDQRIHVRIGADLGGGDVLEHPLERHERHQRAEDEEVDEDGDRRRRNGGRRQFADQEADRDHAAAAERHLPAAGGQARHPRRHLAGEDRADAPRPGRRQREPGPGAPGEAESMLAQDRRLQHEDAADAEQEAEPAERPESIAAGKAATEEGDPQGRRRREHGRLAAWNELHRVADHAVAADEEERGSVEEPQPFAAPNRNDCRRIAWKASSTSPAQPMREPPKSNGGMCSSPTPILMAR